MFCSRLLCATLISTDAEMLLKLATLITMLVGSLAVNAPAQYPMALGRSYNMGTGEVGIDILKAADLEDTAAESIHYLSSAYALVTSASSIHDMLRINSMLTLKSKISDVFFPTISSYLDAKDTRAFVEILTHTIYEKEKVSLFGVRKTNNLCRDGKFQTAATHYVRSVVLGGDMLGSIKLFPKKNSTVASILNEVRSVIGTTGDLQFIANTLVDLEKTINAEIHFDVYGTNPGYKGPHNLREFYKLVELFQTAVSHKSFPVYPLHVELFPISGLLECTKTPLWKSNFKMMSDLTHAEQHFDELKSVRIALNRWIRRFSRIEDRISPANWDKINNFKTVVNSLWKSYTQTFKHLDISVDADPNQVSQLLHLYLSGEKFTVDKLYERQMVELIDSIGKGNWCKWSDYSECSQTCGKSYRARIRQCACPAPIDGFHCDGEGVDMQQCAVTECPEPECSWSKNTTYTGQLSYDPPNFGVLEGIEAIYNATYMDRSWSFYSCHMADSTTKLLNSTKCLKYNQLEYDLRAVCSNGSYITGISSFFADYRGDRTWSVICGTTDRVHIKVDQCKWSVMNKHTTQFSQLKPRSGWLVVGLSSYHYSSIFRPIYADRVWAARICPYIWI